METLNTLWINYGVPIATALIGIGSSVLVIYNTAKKLIGKTFDKTKTVAISNQIVNDVEKKLSKHTMTVAITPIIQTEMDKLTKDSKANFDSLQVAVMALSKQVQTISKAQSCSRLISTELKNELLNGEMPEVIEEVQEIVIADLKIVDEVIETTKEIKGRV